MLPLQFPLGGELRSHMLCGTGQKLNEKRSYPKSITKGCAWPGLYAMDLLSPLPLIQQSWTRGVLRWIPGLRWGKTAGLGPPGAVSLLSGHGSCPATRGTSGASLGSRWRWGQTISPGLHTHRFLWGAQPRTQLGPAGLGPHLCASRWQEAARLPDSGPGGASRAPSPAFSWR